MGVRTASRQTMRARKRWAVVIAVTAVALAVRPVQAQIFVDVNATGSEDGQSWDNAFVSLQDALLVATPGENVWVARGTYYPDVGVAQSDGDRMSSFSLPMEVEVLGGFDGTEFDPDARDPVSNVTILSGDLDQDDVGGADDSTRAENSYHVISNFELTSDSVLDGFTIIGGNADEDGNSTGGGMLNVTSSPTITRCRFIDNFALDMGAGMFNVSGSSPGIGTCHFEGNIANSGGALGNQTNSSPTVSRCIFTSNQAIGDFGWGGGVYNIDGAAELRDCTFQSNVAVRGGGLFNDFAAEVVTVRCIFQDNFAVERGGAVYTTSNTGPFVSCTFKNNSAEAGGAFVDHNASERLITNSVFHGNEASTGAAVALDDGHPCFVGNTLYGNHASISGGGILVDGNSDPNIKNCILWGNTDASGDDAAAQVHFNSGDPFASYSLIQGGWPWAGGTGIIDADPFFRDAAMGDLRLLGGSPAIDAGNRSAVPADVGDVDNDLNTAEVLPLDLGGRPREVNDVATPDTGNGPAPIVDLGAHEFGRRVFVQQDGPGMSLGISWSDPYKTMVEALSFAASSGGTVSEIWVAEGTYLPVLFGSNRSESLVLVNDVAVYGGFAGGETFVFERNPESNDTLLSGDLLGNDGVNFANYGDNSFHVVTGSNTGPSAVLDGFIITGGNADGGGLASRGAGLHIDNGSPTIQNCVFVLNSSENNGAGAWNDNGGSPAFSDCMFRNNRVTSFGGGGGLYSGGGSPRLTRCTFFDNVVSQTGGGLNLNGSLLSAPVLTHCRVIGNEASTAGGINIAGVSATLINCLLSGNSADTAGGIYCSSSSQASMISCSLASNEASSTNGGGIHVIGLSTVLNMRNSILWRNAGQRGSNEEESGQLFVESGNAVVNYSLIQNLTGGLGGSGNVGGNPLFVDRVGEDGIAGTLDDNLALQGGSAAIDAGDTPSMPNDTDDLDDDGDTAERLPLDLAELSRVVDDLATPDTGIPGSPVVDIGSYEHPGGGLLDCNDNGVPDAEDIDNGTSEDCNGNQVPDECDIATCTAPAFPACDDCNLNGVPDACDIQSGASNDDDLDGVPDECAGFTGSCGPGNINWSCVNNWDLGGVFPDNDGGTTYHVTLDDADHVKLDVTVDIDTLRILDNSRLDVTMAGAVGDLTVVQPNGVLVESLLQVASNRSVDVTLGDVFVRDGGLYRADPGATAGTVAATLTVPRLIVQDGGTVLITDHMRMHVTGDMILEDLPGGSPCPNCGGQTPPVTGGSGSGQILVEGDLNMDGSSDINFDSLSVFELHGDFNNEITEPNGFDFGHGHMVLSGLAQSYEVGGSDVGNTLAGFSVSGHSNFSMGTLEIVDEIFVTTDVTLVNDFANIISTKPCAEALYVHTLIIHPGAHVVLDNVRVYYETLINNGSIQAIGACAGAIALPACASDKDCTDNDDCFIDTCNVANGTCEYVPSLAACADGDGDGIRDDNCLWHACSGADCAAPIAIVFGDMGGQFGACAPDGTADGNDRFHALNCFANVAPGQETGTYPCELAPPSAMNVDAGGQFGSCHGDGVCDGNDAFAALNAFDNSTSCGCPLDGGAPAPSGGPLTVAHAGLLLTSTATHVAPGDRIEVDVLLTTPLADLRGFQLHMTATGGSGGSLDLVDISIHQTDHVARRAAGSRRTHDFVFAEAPAIWSAFNIHTGQVLAGMDSDGVAVAAGHLATFTFKASRDARGRFAIELLTAAQDGQHRTYLFPTLPWGRVSLEPVKPLAILIATTH